MLSFNKKSLGLVLLNPALRLLPCILCNHLYFIELVLLIQLLLVLLIQLLLSLPGTLKMGTLRKKNNRKRVIVLLSIRFSSGMWEGSKHILVR